MGNPASSALPSTPHQISILYVFEQRHRQYVQLRLLRWRWRWSSRRLSTAAKLVYICLDSIKISSELFTKAPKACDNLIQNEKDVILSQNRLDFLEVPFWGRNAPASTHDWLGNESRNRVRTLSQYEVLELFGQPRRILLLCFSWESIPPVVWGANVADPRQRQKTETFVHLGHSGYTRCDCRHAVVSLLPRDNLHFVRLPHRSPVVPGQLHVRVVCVGASGREEGLRDTEAWLAELDELRRVLLGYVCRPVPESVLVGQLLHLIASGRNYPLISVPPM